MKYPKPEKAKKKKTSCKNNKAKKVKILSELSRVFIPRSDTLSSDKMVSKTRRVTRTRNSDISAHNESMVPEVNEVNDDSSA